MDYTSLEPQDAAGSPARAPMEQIVSLADPRASSLIEQLPPNNNPRYKQDANQMERASTCQDPSGPPRLENYGQPMIYGTSRINLAGHSSYPAHQAQFYSNQESQQNLSRSFAAKPLVEFPANSNLTCFSPADTANSDHSTSYYPLDSNGCFERPAERTIQHYGHAQPVEYGSYAPQPSTNWQHCQYGYAPRYYEPGVDSSATAEQAPPLLPPSSVLPADRNGHCQTQDEDNSQNRFLYYNSAQHPTYPEYRDRSLVDCEDTFQATGCAPTIVASAHCQPGAGELGSVGFEAIQTQTLTFNERLAADCKPCETNPDMSQANQWLGQQYDSGGFAIVGNGVGVGQQTEQHVLVKLPASAPSISSSSTNGTLEPNRELEAQKLHPLSSVVKDSGGSSSGAARHSQRLNHCGICGRNYARPSTLKTHLRTHTNERPFKCNVCMKTFSQAANLTAHQRVHTGRSLR